MAIFTEMEIGALVDRVLSWNPTTESKDNDFTYIDLSSVDRDTKSIVNPVRTACADAPSRARQLVSAGDILVSTVRPNLNGVAVVPPTLDGATASTGFCVLRPKKEKLCWRYLYHWVRSAAFVRDMTRKSTGASYPAVSDRIIKDSRIPLPKLVEQKRIAAILDKADAIRRKRTDVCTISRESIRDIFLHQFGDPVLNDKGFDRCPIAQVAKIVTGNTPSRDEPENYGDGIEWIKSDNINTPSHYLTESSERLSQVGERKSRPVPAGSTLVTCIAGSPECIGNAALADRRVACNQQINAVVPGERLVDRFLYAMILVLKPAIQQLSSKSMKGMVSKGRFETLPVVVPPMSEQERFAEIFDRIVGMTMKMDKASSESNALFNSLVQRAFKGEL